METIHYHKDKYLIPLKTKIHSGSSAGMSFSHLPSLNFIRQDIGGSLSGVRNFRPEIVSTLLDKDVFFELDNRRVISEWIQNELVNDLQSFPVTDSNFSTEAVTDSVAKFMNTLNRTPHDYGVSHVREVVDSISLANETIPSHFLSEGVIARPVLDFRLGLVNNQVNFRSTGSLPIDKLDNVIINPIDFQYVLAIMNDLPVTDCNVDVIVNVDNSVAYIRDNVVVNRFGIFAKNPISSYSSRELISDILDERFLNKLTASFMNFHPCANDDVKLMLQIEPVKLKFIKTNSDEILVLLFKYNSTSDEGPLCGIYFDSALQSLAPMTVIPDSIIP